MVAAVAVLLGGGALVGPPSVQPQETTETEVVAGTEHLAAIHAGSCRQPEADPAFVLGVVGPQVGDDGEVADAADLRGQVVAPPLLSGGGTVEIDLDTLLDGGQPYALLVHRTAEDTSDPIACGEIGGVVANDQLALPLRPLNRSGYAGVVVLGAAETGGTAGTVLLFSDVDAYAGPRTERGAGGERQRQGGRQGAGGGAASGGASGGQADAVVTGGIAPEPARPGRGDRTPRARRTRVADQPASTAVPPVGDAAGTVPATAEATVEATAEAPDPTAEATVEAPTAVATVEVTATVEPGEAPTVEPGTDAPTAVPDPAVPTTAPPDEAPTAIPGDEGGTDAVEEAPPTEPEGEVPPPAEGDLPPAEGDEPPADPVEETPAA